MNTALNKLEALEIKSSSVELIWKYYLCTQKRELVSFNISIENRTIRRNFHYTIKLDISVRYLVIIISFNIHFYIIVIIVVSDNYGHLYLITYTLYVWFQVKICFRKI